MIAQVSHTTPPREPSSRVVRKWRRWDGSPCRDGGPPKGDGLVLRREEGLAAAAALEDGAVGVVVAGAPVAGILGAACALD